MNMCVFQLYTVSQDGTLCVWESDTELDGLVLRKTRLPAERGEEERGEGEEEEPRGEVIRGKGERPKEKEGTKNVRYKQRSKYVISQTCFSICGTAADCLEGLPGHESNQLLPSDLQIKIDDTYICFGPTECYQCEVGF